MKTLIISFLVTIYTINNLLACDPFYSSYCQTAQSTSYEEMHIFSGTIASKSENNITFNVLELLRGEESRTTFTIWDGPYYVSTDPFCDYVSSGFATKYGEEGDTIICVIELITETETDVDVIGDYRRPSTWAISTFVHVDNGIVGGFNYYDDLVLPYDEFITYACHANVYGCTDADACNYNPAATVDNESCYYDCEKPEVNCPQEETYLCDPIPPPPPLNFEDFEVIDNTTPVDEIGFSVNDVVSRFNQYTIYTYTYYFWDEYGNRTRCSEKFYIPDDTIRPPVINSTLNICQGEESSVLQKPFNDNYLFYTDNNGSVGEFIESCEYNNLLCYGEQLGINTAVAGTYKFWVSKVVRDRFYFLWENKPYFSCESEPVQFTLNINPTPTAVLKDEIPSIRLGQYYNLMDMVEENHNGYWTGQNILSFNSTSGQNFYFFPRKTGLNKVFYNIENGDCTETYTMVIEVQSLRLAENANLSHPLLVFPNPTHGKVYVNLSNSIDVEHSIEVFDINGKLHYAQNVNDVKNRLFEMDLNHLPKGVYVVEMRNELYSDFEKLVIE